MEDSCDCPICFERLPILSIESHVEDCIRQQQEEFDRHVAAQIQFQSEPLVQQTINSIDSNHPQFRSMGAKHYWASGQVVECSGSEVIGASQLDKLYNTPPAPKKQEMPSPKFEKKVPLLPEPKSAQRAIPAEYVLILPPLTNELLDSILQQLEPRHLCALCLVNKALREVASRDMWWEKLYRNLIQSDNGIKLLLKTEARQFGDHSWKINFQKVFGGNKRAVIYNPFQIRERWIWCPPLFYKQAGTSHSSFTFKDNHLFSTYGMDFRLLWNPENNTLRLMKGTPRQWQYLPDSDIIKLTFGIDRWRVEVSRTDPLHRIIRPLTPQFGYWVVTGLLPIPLIMLIVSQIIT